MSAEERETLSLGLDCGHSLRAMAAVLPRAPSTVSRELACNAMRASYRACTSQTLTTARAHQPRRPRKLLDPWLWQYVRTQLTEGCSPEQIAGRLKRADPQDMGKQLSAETIYMGLYVLPRGALRSALPAGLHQARNARLPRSRGTDRRGQIPNRTSIVAHPAEVMTRMVPGHREGDFNARARNGWQARRHLASERDGHLSHLPVFTVDFARSCP
jgi:transposase, IS30 family